MLTSIKEVFIYELGEKKIIGELFLFLIITYFKTITFYLNLLMTVKFFLETDSISSSSKLEH